MTRLFKVLFYYPLLAPIVLTIIIFILSIIAGFHLPKIEMDWLASDKIGHALAYFSLSFSWLMGWKFYTNITLHRKHIFCIALACIAFGVLMEVLQGTLFTYRTFEWADAIANTVGVILGVLASRLR